MGPKGIGALYMRRRPIRVRLEAQIHGGGHEFGMRSGTLAPHQIVGMGEALHLAKLEMAENNGYIAKLSERFWSGIKDLPGIALHGDETKRVPHNLNFSFAGISSADLVTELADLALSTGSACLSSSLAPSHVLKAIGVSNASALGSVRCSFGKYTTMEEIDYAITCIGIANPKITSVGAGPCVRPFPWFMV